MAGTQEQKHTPLFQAHLEAKAQMVDFAGWQMPMNYGSQINEHHQVRRDAGLFDVSHMTITDIEGSNARAYLRYLLANDVGKLEADGQALYTCMLNHQGGVLDDLIVYRLGETHYRIITNAATKDKIRDWLEHQNEQFQAQISPRDEWAMIAAQGPNAVDKTVNALELPRSVHDLDAFQAMTTDGIFISRTGYTGEDGLELLMDAEVSADYWQRLVKSGCAPAGLGARDTLRLEAGLNLYGHDMDESNHPFESNLGWTVAWKPEDRDFIGREALSEIKGRSEYRLIGLLLENGGVLRPGQTVITADESTGVITSGSYSPTLDCSIALARVPRGFQRPLQAQVRKRQLEVRPVKPPFVKNAQPTYKELNHA